MWNFIYIYLLVFSVSSTVDQILKSDSIPHTLAAVTQRQRFLPGSEERMNQHSAGLWSPAVGCDCRLWWWEGSHLRFESTPSSPSREAHAQGRNLKVIKNQSQRCVWERETREREVILILTFTGGVLGQGWAVLCLESESQWFNVPGILMRVVLWRSAYKTFWVIFNIISLFRIRGLLFILANKNFE